MGLYKYARKYLSQVKKLDFYGKTMAFTYKGEDCYKTYLGACTSFMITIVILVYSLTLLKMMVEFKGYKSNVNTVIHDLSDDSDPLYLENSTFQIAFEVSYVYENSTVYSTGIDSFLNISLGQAIQTTNENGQVEINHHIRQYSQ